MPFSLTSNPSLGEISDAINYLLNNFGSNVTIDIQTGIIAGPTGRISNLYQYMSIKYATSYDGSVGFSNVPTGATYYGIRNSNSTVESTNPADYIWYKTTGFGTTNYLWYIVAGGRQIDFFVSATQPSQYYVKDPGTAIDLDVVTTTSTQNVALPAIYQWTSGSAPTRPTTTSTYTWATASYSAPSGWTTTPSSNTTSGWVQWAIYVPITANSNTATSVIDWTNTAYPIVQFSSNGANGATGATGGNGLSSITAYLQQSQISSAPSTPANTTGPTAPTGWSLTAPTSVTVGNVVWYTFGQYNSSSGTISGIPAGQTQWSAPVAASIFQDIQSNNWNGSTPPTYSNSSTWGTQGYYLRQGNTTGSPSAIYINNGIFRGDITTQGQAKFYGNSNASFSTNIAGTVCPVYYCAWGRGDFSTGTTGAVASGVFGYNESFSSKYTAGVLGIGRNGTTGSVGVYGDGTTFGVYSWGNFGLGNGGTFNYNGVVIQDPSLLTPGSNYFLRGDGVWTLISSITSGVSSFNSRTGAVTLSSTDVTNALGYTPYNSSNPAGYVTSSTTSLTNYSTTSVTLSYLSGYSNQFNANSGTAFASSSQISLYGSTSTGIAGAYVGTSASGNVVTFGVQTTSPSDIRLKEEVSDINLGLDFVNKLRPVSYKLKADPRHQKGYGFIADEVEPLVEKDTSLVYYEPDWQVGDQKGFKTIHYPSYVAVLTKAIQELNGQVTELKLALNKKNS